MKVASFKTLSRCKKTRERYAVRAIYRAIFNNEECASYADKVSLQLMHGIAIKQDVLFFACREQEYRLLNDDIVQDKDHKLFGLVEEAQSEIDKLAE